MQLRSVVCVVVSRSVLHALLDGRRGLEVGRRHHSCGGHRGYDKLAYVDVSCVDGSAMQGCRRERKVCYRDLTCVCWALPCLASKQGWWQLQSMADAPASSHFWLGLCQNKGSGWRGGFVHLDCSETAWCLILYNRCGCLFERLGWEIRTLVLGA